MTELDPIFPFRDRMSAEEQDYAARSCVREHYEKGSLIQRTDESCKGILAVLRGSLRVYIVSDEGREVTLYRIPAGESCILAASCLMESIDFDVLIEAAEESEILVLPAPALRQIMERNGAVELYLYKEAASRFSDVMWGLQQLLFRRLDQRVGRFLWDEISRTGAEELRVTHDEIARDIGSAREVVTKVLKSLAADGILALSRGKITVTDREKLKTLIL